MNRIISRALSLSSRRLLKQITETTNNGVTTVQLEDVKETAGASYLKTAHEPGCCICNAKLPMKIKYTDVLILEQFMREDGTVLPPELTGVCTDHQGVLERCVMQAHWSGLFPDRTTADFVRSGYMRFNRWWRDDEEMFKPELKTIEGTWHYIKRYNPKVNELSQPIVYDKSPKSGHGQWENSPQAVRPAPSPLPFAASLQQKRRKRFEQ